MEEKPCFADLAREIGVFYAAEPPADLDNPDGPSASASAKHGHGARVTPEYARYLDTVEHVLFPAFKEHLVVPQRWATTGDIVELANLSDLYKIFERC